MPAINGKLTRHAIRRSSDSAYGRLQVQPAHNRERNREINSAQRLDLGRLPDARRMHDLRQCAVGDREALLQGMPAESAAGSLRVPLRLARSLDQGSPTGHTLRRLASARVVVIGRQTERSAEVVFASARSFSALAIPKS